MLKSDDAFAEQPLYFGNPEGSENFAKSNYLLWYYALRLSANVENESLDKHPFAYLNNLDTIHSETLALLDCKNK